MNISLVYAFPWRHTDLFISNLVQHVEHNTITSVEYYIVGVAGVTISVELCLEVNFATRLLIFDGRSNFATLTISFYTRGNNTPISNPAIIG